MMRLEARLEKVIWLEITAQLEDIAFSTTINTFKSDFSENP